MSDSPDQALFSLLPTSNEGRTRAFVTSSIVNLAMLGIALYVGATARQVIEQHYEETVLVMPSLPPPVKFHKPRPVAPPKIKLPPPRIEQPKPVQMEARLAAPPIPHVRPQIKLTPQVRPALASAMPAQNNLVRPSTRPVHLGDTFGVVPNPNAVRPATVAAIGNPYGGMEGPAVAPHGVVRSTGIGDSTRFGSGGGGGYRRWWQSRIRQHAWHHASRRHAARLLHARTVHAHRGALQAAGAVHSRGKAVANRR